MDSRTDAPAPAPEPGRTAAPGAGSPPRGPRPGSGPGSGPESGPGSGPESGPEPRDGAITGAPDLHPARTATADEVAAFLLGTTTAAPPWAARGHPAGDRGRDQVDDQAGDKVDDQAGDEGGGHRGRPRGISGIRVTGSLDLARARIERSVIFRECEFDAPIAMGEAIVGGLRLERCLLAGLHARRLRCRGGLSLAESWSAGPVSLREAWIEADTDLDGATIRGDGTGPALELDDVIIRGHLSLEEEFGAVGGISMRGAQVNGDLRLKGAALDGTGRDALDGTGVVVDREVQADSLEAGGSVRLTGIKVGGSLRMLHARLSCPEGGALLLDHALVEGDLLLEDGFRSDGLVRLTGGHVGGSLVLQGARGTCAGVVAPAAETDDGRPEDAATAFRFDRTHIDGDLRADQLISGGVVSLTGCAVRGNVVFDGATLEAEPPGIALDAARLSSMRDVRMSGGVAVRGPVVLSGARVEGRLEVDADRIDCAAGDVALDLAESRSGILMLKGAPGAGVVDLTRASAGVLQDDPADWKGANSQLVLDGIEFAAVHMAEVDVADRIAWLRKGTGVLRAGSRDYRPAGFQPSPYERLARAYHDAGQHEDAHRIMVAGRRDRRSAIPWRRFPTKFGDLLQDFLIGYGYAPARLLSWLVLALIAGTLFFYFDPPVPTAAGHGQTFTLTHSVNYVVDLLIPVDDLDAASDWHPVGDGGRLVAACLVTMGWTVSVLFIATLGRLFPER